MMLSGISISAIVRNMNKVFIGLWFFHIQTACNRLWQFLITDVRMGAKTKSSWFPTTCPFLSLLYGRKREGNSVFIWYVTHFWIILQFVNIKSVIYIMRAKCQPLFKLVQFFWSLCVFPNHNCYHVHLHSLLKHYCYFHVSVLICSSGSKILEENLGAEDKVAFCESFLKAVHKSTKSKYTILLQIL